MTSRAEIAAHEAAHATLAVLLGKYVYGISLYASAGVTSTQDHSDLADAIVCSIPGASRPDTEQAEAICARLRIEGHPKPFVTCGWSAPNGPGRVKDQLRPIRQRKSS